MSANVVPLKRLFRRSWDWSPRELAEFYRVESALIQAGLKIDTERGLSDEGDPWFAFCRPDDGEVIVHIARIGGVYILAGPSYDGIASGGDIAALVRDLVTRHPLIQTRGDNPRQGSKIFLHPAALLIAVVATAFFKSTEARALADDHKSGGGDGRGGGVAVRPENVAAFDHHTTVVMEATQSAVILSAVAAVLQGPSALATEQEHENIASTTSVLNLAASSPSAQHSATPFSIDQTFESYRDLHGQIISGVVPHLSADPAVYVNPAVYVSPAVYANPTPSVHATIADALPLIVVLWDLSATNSVTKTIAHDNASDTSAASTGSSASVVATGNSPAIQSSLLTFKMVSSADVHQDLPTVQAVKVSYSSAQAAEPQTISNHNLPAALLSALKDATHVDTQPNGLPNSTSFANALFLSVTGNSEQAPNANALILSATDHSSQQGHQANASAPPTDHSVDTSVSQPHSGSSTTQSGTSTQHSEPSTQPSGPTTQASGPITQSQTATADAHSNVPVPSEKDAQFSALVQDFFNHTPHWATVNDGRGVVVYDTDAMTSHASELVAVSFDFSDGSTLSLVGLPVALPHSLFA